MLIKNKTPQLLVFAGAHPETSEQFPTVAIPQGRAVDVPDSLWALHKDRENIQALLASGRILALGGSTAPAPEPEPEPVRRDG